MNGPLDYQVSVGRIEHAIPQSEKEFHLETFRDEDEKNEINSRYVLPPLLT